MGNLIALSFFRDLSHNSIVSIAVGAFNHQASTLVSLVLNNNDLTYFAALASMPSLKSVNLADNNIVSIAVGAFDNALQDIASHR